jgi:hypothetical protein
MLALYDHLTLEGLSFGAACIFIVVKVVDAINHRKHKKWMQEFNRKQKR